MRWLRQHDLSDNYMRLNPNNVSQEAVISSGLRFIEAWYHFTDIRRLDGSEATRPVQARPRYIVASSNDAPPDTPGASLVHQTPDFNIYLLPDSLPYAFLASRQALTPQEGKGELVRDDVTELTAFSPSPNRVEVIAEGKGGETLVVLTTHYPGWQVKVDGKAQAIAQSGRLPGSRRVARRSPIHLRVPSEALLHRAVHQPGLPGDNDGLAAFRPAVQSCAPPGAG